MDTQDNILQNQNQQNFDPHKDVAPLMLPVEHDAPKISFSEIQIPPSVQIQSDNQIVAPIIDVKYEIKEEKYPSQKDAIFHIEVEKIKSNPFQPRTHFDEESLKELAASIREFGVIQPIVVVKNEIESDAGTQVEYQLIAGERRLKASKLAGLERIPAIVKKLPKKADQMEMAIVENLQRANLDSIETARAYARLSDEFGLTQREIAARLGKSRETIANAIRLLNLPTEIQTALAEGRINESQARLLLTIKDLANQIEVYKDLLLNNLSVRELKNKIRRTTESESQGIAPIMAKADPEINHLQEQLTDLLGAPVKIEKSDNQNDPGKIVISFYSPEEIRGIIEKLNPHIK
ncbi:ParB/RepB/Spo0J family partition protein [Candidatus Wolfebacteria bacterium]|nr:ParB/RepB/Spo0J family partition protein [Candidatus Wolfebacteria bacterium]